MTLFLEETYQSDVKAEESKPELRSWPMAEALRKVYTSTYSEHTLYTRSIMNVSRARFTHSRQNGTLAESRYEEGSLTGSFAQPDTWRIPHSSPPFQPGTHTDRAITARGEGPQPTVFRPTCCVSVQGRDGRGVGATSRRIRF